MAKAKETKHPKNLDFPIKPEGRERFTAILKDAYWFGLLSIHEFDGVKYQVTATMAAGKDTAVEFVRMP